MSRADPIAVGDRVYAHYREHSIPTRTIDTVTDVERGWVTVDVSPVELEAGSLVCVPLDMIEPVQG